MSDRGYTREHAVAELRELTRAAMGLLETKKGEKLPAAIRRLGEAIVPFAWALAGDDSIPAPAPTQAESYDAPTVIDCGDSGCRFAPTKTGMRTNGGCSCYERAGFGPSAVQAAKQMLPEILRLRAKVAALSPPGTTTPDEDSWQAAYETLTGLLRARFPMDVNGGDWAIEEVLRENARLREKEHSTVAEHPGHLIDGEFQSDKYPTTPRGKVPLSCRDATAQDLLWEYAQRRRAVDAQFADDLEEALRIAGYDSTTTPDVQAQVDALAKFIMENIPGEPSQSEGAVDTAIRLLTDRQAQVGAAVAAERERVFDEIEALLRNLCVVYGNSGPRILADVQEIRARSAQEKGEGDEQ